MKYKNIIIIGLIIILMISSTNATTISDINAVFTSNISADCITLNSGEPVCWNSDVNTLSIPTGLGNTIQVGQELTLTRKNKAGKTIYAGQIVYDSGSQGEKVTVDLADASNGSKIHNLGIVTIPSCVDNADCPITYFGDIHDIDTSAYTEGDIIYLSDDGSGNTTNIIPSGNSYHIKVGIVNRVHKNVGIINFQTYTDFSDTPVMNSLHVLTNTLLGPEVGEYAFYNTPGDLYLGNGSQGIYNGQLGIWSLPYGAPLIVNKYMSGLNFSSLGGTATLNSTTQYICDSTDPFRSYHKDMYLEVVGGTPDFTGATGEIETIINSTCIEISFAAAGADIIPDGTGLMYIVYPHPIMAILDNGHASFSIGENADARFEIHNEYGNGPTGVLIEDNAGTDNHRALSIDTDMQNYDGQTALGIHMGTSENQIINKDITMINLEGDASQMNSSTGTFINMQVLGQPLTEDSTMKAFRVPPHLDKIIDVGSAETVDIVYDQGNNISSTVISEDGIEEIFTNDDDVLYVGADVNFTLVGFQLDDVSSKDIKSDYFYCDNTGTWQELTGVSDSTNGFRSSGIVRFPNPIDRGTCNEQLDGTPFTNTTNYAYIAIQRTEGKAIDAPTLKFISISGTGTSMMMSEDLLRLHPVDTAPDTCSAVTLGAIYFDISEDDMCICKSGGWFVMEDGSACT